MTYETCDFHECANQKRNDVGMGQKRVRGVLVMHTFHHRMERYDRGRADVRLLVSEKDTSSRVNDDELGNTESRLHIGRNNCECCVDSHACYGRVKPWRPSQVRLIKQTDLGTPRIYSWSAEFEFELVMIGDNELELGG